MKVQDGPGLWDAWEPPTTADPMSRTAAATMRAPAGTIRRTVAAYIAEHGPVAEWQIERALELDGNTAQPRVWELHRHGVIERVPERGVTPSGRPCHRYVVTALGRAILEVDR